MSDGANNNEDLLSYEEVYRHYRHRCQVTMSPEKIDAILLEIDAAVQHPRDAAPFKSRHIWNQFRNRVNTFVRDTIPFNDARYALATIAFVISIGLLVSMSIKQDDLWIGEEPIAGLPPSLVHEANAVLDHIDAIPPSGAGFSGANAMAIAFRLGRGVTELLVTSSAESSLVRERILSRAETVLEIVVQYSGDDRSRAAVDALQEALRFEDKQERFARLIAASSELSAVLGAANLGAAQAFDLGRDLEAINLGTSLAASRGEYSALNEALDLFAERWGTRELDIWPAGVEEEIEELIALKGSSRLDPEDIRRRITRFRLLFGGL